MKINKILSVGLLSITLFSGTSLLHTAHADQINPTVSIKLNQKDEIKNFHSLAKTAKKHLGLHYVWGGTTTKGFDCSGFTQFIYEHALHKSLPRTAQAQFNYGTSVLENNAKKGDLVFFGSSKSNIDHVGIYLGNGKMIDSQNRGIVIENIHASWWHLAGFAHY